ncbi:Uncharacterized protein QTN25_003780 [Entamoeba marina]
MSFQPPSVLSFIQNDVSQLAIYLISSLYLQILGMDAFSMLRPYSYILSPLAVMLPGNLMMFYLGTITASPDVKLYVAVSHFIFAFIVMNSNMKSRQILLVGGAVCVLFNLSGFITFYQAGSSHGALGSFIYSYIPMVVIPYVYTYLVTYSFHKHQINTYANPKSFIRNSIVFSFTFGIVYVLQQYNFPQLYVVVLIMFTLQYLDQYFWHKLPELFHKAKLD